MACPTGSMEYTIRAGDTLYNIARTFGVTVDSIMRANPGINPNNLQIGQVICVPVTSSPPPTQPCPLLAIGARGASVTELQNLLVRNGFNPGPIDGIFGQRTQAAVMAFQRSKGLVVDGIVGVMTWTALGVNCGPSTTCPAGTFPHTIVAGDTFFKLAQQYNTTVDAIQRANPNVNPNNLIIGQTLCIPR